MTVTLFRGTRRLADAYSDGFTLAVHRCGSCGIVFAFEEEFDTTRRRDHASWYCPNGHSFSYTGPSDVEKLRSELEEERQRRKAARDLLDHEQRSHAATRGHLTRTKKRIAAGVCPCCNRSFAQLSRHIATQHPDYLPA
jgi:hypothetical protein